MPNNISTLRQQWKARGFSAKEARYLAAMSATNGRSDLSDAIPTDLARLRIENLPIEAQANAYAQWLTDNAQKTSAAQVRTNALRASNYAKKVAKLEATHVAHVKSGGHTGVTGGYVPDADAPARKLIKIGDVYSLDRKRVIRTKNKLEKLPKKNLTALPEKAIPETQGVIIRTKDILTSTSKG